MISCPKCKGTKTVSTGFSGNFRRCLDCNYIWQYLNKKKKKPVKEKEVYENTAADDYLDWLSDQW